MKIILFLIIITTPLFGQKVSNINFSQEQNNILVTYNLETKNPCKVSLFVSTNGGESWKGPLKKVEGHIGKNIKSGFNNIIWKVLEEFDELRGEKIMFQVRAIDDDFETVLIGNQEWASKNLNVSKYKNGDIIPEVKDLNEWSNLKTGAWCYYNNDPVNGAIYGKLYNWYAVNDPRGLAPDGFHIPTRIEWLELAHELGGKYIAGKKMKNTKGWGLWKKNGKKPVFEEIINEDTTNETGFSALPGGYRLELGWHFGLSGENGFWWSTSKYSDSEAFYFYLDLKYNELNEGNKPLKSGLSVRCIRD
jgi:uncharacterized protein (TIGR02145 family)